MSNPPKSPGRPLGSKNNMPRWGKIHDELLKCNFEWMKEFAALYASADDVIKRDLLLGIAKYLWPMRKPEDSNGDASENVAQVIVSQTQLLELVAAARNTK